MSTCVKAHPGWAANWGLNVGLVITDALRGKPVNIGRFEMRMAGATQVIKPQLIAHDEENVALFSCHL